MAMDRLYRCAYVLVVLGLLTNCALADDAAPAESTAITPNSVLNCNFNECSPGDCSPTGCDPACCNSGIWNPVFKLLDTSDYEYQPRWTISLGAVVLGRSQPAPMQLVHPLGSTATVSNGSDFISPAVTGIDFSATRLMNSGNSWQIRFLGGFDWNANANYGAVGNVQIGSFSNFGATGLTANYSTRLNSTEINWLRPIGDRISFLAGFRAISLHDQLTYHITFPAFNANYTWNDNNHMYGGQLGSVINLWRVEGPLRVTGTMKGGVFNNAANNNFSLIPSTGGMNLNGGSATQASFAGEINIAASYTITSHLAVRGGYELLWIDRVALASNQVAMATANNTQAGITMNGNTFYNGFMGGFDVTW